MQHILCSTLTATVFKKIINKISTLHLRMLILEVIRGNWLTKTKTNNKCNKILDKLVPRQRTRSSSMSRAMHPINLILCIILVPRRPHHENSSQSSKRNEKSWRMSQTSTPSKPGTAQANITAKLVHNWYSKSRFIPPLIRRVWAVRKAWVVGMTS